MSRRDTIIVAVLVNAALLMILFATAGRSKSSDTSASQNQIQLADSGKEDLLNQFISSSPTLAETKLPPVVDRSVALETEEIIHEIPASTLAALPSTPIATNLAEQKVTLDETRFVNVTVKKGDVLEKIARANQTSVSAIMKANNLLSTQLKIGQTLKIPLPSSHAVGGSTNPIQMSDSEEFYVVKEGDNPWLIASKNHVKLDQLLQLNGLNEEKARKLRPGDRLKIR